MLPRCGVPSPPRWSSRSPAGKPLKPKTCCRLLSHFDEIFTHAYSRVYDLPLQSHACVSCSSSSNPQGFLELQSPGCRSCSTVGGASTLGFPYAFKLPYVCVCMYVCMYVRTYVTYVGMYVCMYVCMHECIYVCMHIYICIYIYMYIHVHRYIDIYGETYMYM